MHSSRTWVRDWTYFVVYYNCFCTTCVLLKFMFYQKTLPRNYCASLYVNHFHCSNLLVCKTVYIIACSPTTKSCIGVTLLRRYYIVVISSLMKKLHSLTNVHLSDWNYVALLHWNTILLFVRLPQQSQYEHSLGLWRLEYFNREGNSYV